MSNIHIKCTLYGNSYVYTNEGVNKVSAIKPGSLVFTADGLMRVVYKRVKLVKSGSWISFNDGSYIITVPGDIERNITQINSDAQSPISDKMRTLDFTRYESSEYSKDSKDSKSKSDEESDTEDIEAKMNSTFDTDSYKAGMQFARLYVNKRISLIKLFKQYKYQASQFVEGWKSECSQIVARHKTIQQLMFLLKKEGIDTSILATSNSRMSELKLRKRPSEIAYIKNYSPNVILIFYEIGLDYNEDKDKDKNKDHTAPILLVNNTYIACSM